MASILSRAEAGGRGSKEAELLGAARPGRALFALIEERGFEVGQEGGRRAPGAGEEEEARAGAGDADEEEAPLFGDVGLLGAGPDEREEAVLAADQEDDGELQPFGGVEGEKR